MHHGPNIHCAVVVRLQGDAGLSLRCRLPAARTDQASRGRAYAGSRARSTAISCQPSRTNRRTFSLFTEPPAGGDSRWRYRIHNLAVDDPTFEHHWERSFTASMNSQLVLSHATAESHVFVHKHRLRTPHDRIRQAQRERTRTGWSKRAGVVRDRRRAGGARLGAERTGQGQTDRRLPMKTNPPAKHLVEPVKLFVQPFYTAIIRRCWNWRGKNCDLSTARRTTFQPPFRSTTRISTRTRWALCRWSGSLSPTASWSPRMHW